MHNHSKSSLTRHQTNVTPDFAPRYPALRGAHRTPISPQEVQVHFLNDDKLNPLPIRRGAGTFGAHLGRTWVSVFLLCLSYFRGVKWQPLTLYFVVYHSFGIRSATLPAVYPEVCTWS